MGIAAASGKQQVEAAYKDLAVQDRGKTDNIASYRGYLLTKALKLLKVKQILVTRLLSILEDICLNQKLSY